VCTAKLCHSRGSLHPDSRVGGGALPRRPPSAAQTARAVFPHATFTKTRDLRWKEKATAEWPLLTSGKLSPASSILGRCLLAAHLFLPAFACHLPRPTPVADR